VHIVEGPLRGMASYACRPVAGGTELTVISDVHPQGRWRLAARAIGGLLHAELALSCQRLKALLEEPAGAMLRSDEPAFRRPGRELVAT
jgi:hypothetical protein